MGFRLTNGAIFLHIPKTGGSFVTWFLKEQGLLRGAAGGQHDDVFRSLAPQNYRSRVTRITRELPQRVVSAFNRAGHDWRIGPRPEQPEIDDLPWMFCFVRHPLSWIQSYYSYTAKQGWPYWSSEYDYLGFWHPNAVLNDLRSDSFNVFVEKLLRKRPGYVTELYGWYTTAGVRFIGKQESLRGDLMSALDMLGLNYDRDLLLSAARKNSSQDDTAGIVWDNQLKQEFLRCEYPGLRRYGYLA